MLSIVAISFLHAPPTLTTQIPPRLESVTETEPRSAKAATPPLPRRVLEMRAAV